MSWSSPMGASPIAASSGSCWRKVVVRARPSMPPWLSLRENISSTRYGWRS